MSHINPRRLVLFGAGMTGRGQIAQLAYEDGWELTLVEKDRHLVEQLLHAGQYRVQLLSNNTREVIIQGFKVFHTSDSEAINAAICQADLIVTSVLEPNLPDVAKILALALIARFNTGNRHPVNIIAAENMGDSSSRLRSYVWQQLPESWKQDIQSIASFPNSMISRVVPIADDPLDIITEEYSEWTADDHVRVGEPPALAGLEWVSNQSARLFRKLYIHNTGHFICGALGWLSNYHFIHEAAQDPAIMGHIRTAIAESGEAISQEYDFSRLEVKAYEEHLLGRLIISALADDIRRVIRHPVRKLSKDERLVGPLLLCEKYDLPLTELCYGIAAVLAGSYIPYGFREYDNQAENIRKTLDRVGPVKTLVELADFQPTTTSSRLIVDAYESLIAN
jgi:mannitol-1-phosphate 5-dehydrogenase